MIHKLGKEGPTHTHNEAPPPPRNLYNDMGQILKTFLK